MIKTATWSAKIETALSGGTQGTVDDGAGIVPISAIDAVGLSEDADNPGLALLRIPTRSWISNTKFIVSTPKNSASALVSVDVHNNTMECVNGTLSINYFAITRCFVPKHIVRV